MILVTQIGIIWNASTKLPTVLVVRQKIGTPTYSLTLQTGFEPAQLMRISCAG